MFFSQSDDELMIQVSLGSHRAFAKLFDRHAPKVFGLCLRLLKERSKAEDVSQEVWMKVVRHANKYTSHGKFVAWLMTLTRNGVMDAFRANRQFDFTESIENQNEQAHYSQSDLEEIFSQKRDLEKVKQIIDELPDTQRLVFMTWMTESPSYEHLAREFSTSVSAIKSLLFRARQKINSELERKNS